MSAPHLRPSGNRPIGFVPAPFECDWMGHHFDEGDDMLLEHAESVKLLRGVFQ